MAYTYPNKIKLARAEALARADEAKPEADRKTVHEHYVALGGLVIGEEEVVEAPKKEEEVKEEKPKKGKK